jgi:hypothetical protein
MLDPARLVFIDETAVSTNMVRLGGAGSARRQVDRPCPARRMADDHGRGAVTWERASRGCGWLSRKGCCLDDRTLMCFHDGFMKQSTGA